MSAEGWTNANKIVIPIVAAILAAGVIAFAAACTGQKTLEPGIQVVPPWGVQSFCENHPEECRDE